MDALRKIPTPAWILLVGALLIFPKLQSFGLWDPAEIRLADVARDLSEGKKVTPSKRPTPPLSTWVMATGFKVLGINELAGRLPLALAGLLALLLANRIISRLFTPKAGLLAALVLVTTPAFLFQSRQLASDMIYYLALLASAGGLACYLWPQDNRHSRLDLAIGGLGLVAGFLAKGWILGFFFPIFCLALAIGDSWRTRSWEEAIEETKEEVDGESPFRGSDVAIPTDYHTVSQSVSRHWQKLALAVGAALLVSVGFYFYLGGGSGLWFALPLKKVTLAPTFDKAFRDLGFGTFPWFGLLPAALFLFVRSQMGGAEKRTRDAFGKVLILSLVVIGYLLMTVWPGFAGKIRFPALPWLCLGIGVFLYQGFTRELYLPLLGITALALLLVLQQDFYVSPGSLAFSHLTEKAKFPVDLNIKWAVRGFGVAFALLFFTALGGRVYLTTWLKRFDPAGKVSRWAWFAMIPLSLTLAGWNSWVLTPQLSLHMSNKALFQTYHECKKDGEKLSQYRVSGRGAAYYNNGKIDQVGDQKKLFQLLKAKTRTFVLVPADQMASLDRSARQSKVPYYVLDDRNSKYLILSNQLDGKCSEDKNPLRRFVLQKRPNPAHAIAVNFEDRVEMIGYDMPAEVRRPGKLKMRLYFHVKTRVPANYKLFMHFDQPGHRFHGDHTPLGGKYPTQYWLPGDYIIDEYEIDLPLLTTPGGTYTPYIGFWLGNKRLKVKSGPADKSNRVRLGKLRVR
jgi:hypothetical protein